MSREKRLEKNQELFCSENQAMGPWTTKKKPAKNPKKWENHRRALKKKR